MSFLEDFDKGRDAYQKFLTHLELRLKYLLEERVPLVQIEGRLKSRKSAADKLHRKEKGGKYKTLGDMTDLVGLRIVVYDKDNIKPVCKIIRDNFAIDDANSVNKESELQPKEFGYTSIHYVVSLPLASPDSPSPELFRSFKAEIQVRSLLQHMWAATDRDLQYRQKGIPRDLERAMYQLAALLELADDLFASIKRRRKDAEAKTQENLKLKPTTVPVNTVSLSLSLTEPPFDALVQSARNAGFAIDPASPDEIAHLAKLCEQLPPINSMSDLQAEIGKTAQWREGFFRDLKQGPWVASAPLIVLLTLAALYASTHVTADVLVRFGFGQEMADRVIRVAQAAKRQGAKRRRKP